MRALFGVALAALLTAGVAALLPAREDGRRAHLPQAMRSVELAGLEDATVAGFTVEYASDARRFRYARARGRWRALDAFNTACEDEDAGGVVLGILASTAIRRAEDGQAYGFDHPDALVLRLHGKGMLSDPEGDVLLEMEVGSSNQAAGASEASAAFVRLRGVDGLFELDVDPRNLLGPYTPGGFPPLLDTRLVPQAFPPPGDTVSNIYVERADGTTFELARRARQPDAPGPDIDAERTLPFEWLLSIDGEQVQLPPWRGEGFSTFITHARFVGLEDPRLFEEHGFDTPSARITMISGSGESIVLEFGAATDTGGVWVLQRAASLLVTVDATTMGMLLPTREDLQDRELENAWDTWLRAELQAQR